MKLLFCINDDRIDNLPATRKVFRDFYETGTFSGYKEYGYQPRTNDLGSIVLMENELLNVIKNFKPDLIHWNQLNNRWHLSKKFILNIKEMLPQVIITQETVDSFNKLPSAMLNAGKHFDITLLNCNELVRKMNKKGCNNVLLFPEKSTDSLFEENHIVTKKQFDIVFIGNNNSSKNFFKHREKLGPRYRTKLIVKMKKYFGDRFTVFGRGWDNIIENKGFLPFGDQVQIMKSARLLFGCNVRNYYTYYFSNRLTNSMLSGTPIVYQYNPGYEKLFSDNEHIIYFYTPEDAIRKVEDLIVKEDQYLEGIGRNAKQLVMKKHTAQKRYQYYINLVTAYKNNNLPSMKPDFFLEGKF